MMIKSYVINSLMRAEPLRLASLHVTRLGTRWWALLAISKPRSLPMNKQNTQTLYSPSIRTPNQTPILLIADTKDHPDPPDRAKRSITNQETNLRNALCA